MISLGLIITAAGIGQRFHHQQNKLLMPLNGTTVINYTLSRFNSLGFQQKVITIHSEAEKEMISIMDNYPDFEIVQGGNTRSKSVKNGLMKLWQCEWVLIHDGVRPNVSQKLISRVIESKKNVAAVIPGIPATDTIKVVSEGYVKKTLDRHTLIQVQTPQLVHRRTLLEAYKNGDIQHCTDEASILERDNQLVKWVMGEPENIKITSQKDLKLLRYLLQNTGAPDE